jgi:SpoVK/Ycf46/Vps4 family AAA+-type ATPase
MSPQNDTGFDAFFQAITTSPEFKSVVTKDWKWDSMDALERSLLDMQAGVEKAGKLMENLNTNFAIDDVSSPQWGYNNWTSMNAITPPKTWNAKDEQEKPAVEVQRFVRVVWKPWGFDAVAGMDSLKTELKESFIKPLKFKFLVEKLRKNSLAPSSWTEWRIQDQSETLDSSQAQNDETIKTKNNELILKLYTEYEKFKISIPTGMLFYGPPGTGKTFITKKLAEELGCGFISKNMGEFGSSYLHQTTKNIKDFFEWAKKAALDEPIILFLDEIDSLVSARTNNVDANKAEEVSQFLQEFNSLELAPNLIVIAATNRPDHLDPAILRSWRLDKKIYLGPPDEIARRELFKMYIEKAGRPSEKLDYDELARLSDGYVSADIEAMCDEVARDASRDLLDLVDEAESGKLTAKDLDGHKITMKSLQETIAETPSSLKMVDMSVYEGWLEKIK